MINKKSILSLLVLLLILSIFLLAGCSNTNKNNPREPNSQNRRMMNLTSEERQRMIESRGNMSGGSMLSIACQNKSEGDECNITSIRANMTGKCQTQQDNLICIIQGFNRTRQIPNNG